MSQATSGDDGLTKPASSAGVDRSALLALAHVADQSVPDIYQRAWAEWQACIEEHEPDAPVDGQRVLLGFEGESVPCRVDLPAGEARALLVRAPDADNAWMDPERFLDRGVGVVQVGLRGCDAGERAPADWACEGLGEGFDRGEQAIGWRLMQAAGDVGMALIAGSRLGVELWGVGRSLGGGLLVLAAAGLAGMPKPPAQVKRMVLELPALGDWKWRWAQAARASVGGASASGAMGVLEGVAGGLLKYAGRFPARRSEMFDSLRIADAALAAPRVRAPVLCKLATQDPIVPAPAAAAVFNAIASPTGRKWRFVVPRGHHDAAAKGVDLGNARAHAAFDRCAADFLDPDRSPAQAMLDWFEGGEARTEVRAHATERETGLFGGPSLDEETARLCAAYEHAGRTLDDLPYTEAFESLYEEVSSDGRPSKRDVLHGLHTLRKAGRLARLGRGSTPPPAIADEHEQLLIELVEAAIGKLSLRDRLPYTPEFDELVAAFNARASLSLGPHEVWRLIAKLAK